MADIRHRIEIAAPQERVYRELTTKDGFSRWWTRDVTGEEGPGGKLEFLFGAAEPSATFEVTEQTPDSHVVLRCVQGPEEWIGTDLNFRLTPGVDDGTVVLFSHAGLAATRRVHVPLLHEAGVLPARPEGRAGRPAAHALPRRHEDQRLGVTPRGRGVQGAR